jgi:hypothetical protein
LKWWVIIIKQFSVAEILLRSSDTVLKASRSRPESISSRIIYFGHTNFICKISIFLFSHPENHTLSSLSRKDSSIFNSCKIFLINLLNKKGESSLVSGEIVFK